ncbi:hypothetical protein D3C72_2083800 [compost metagenome]
MHRPRLTTSVDPRLQRRNQTTGEFTGGGFKSRHHCGDHRLLRQHIACGHAFFALHHMINTQRLVTAKGGAATAGVNDSHLAILAKAIFCQRAFRCLFRR